jgi:hypothetical protein
MHEERLQEVRLLIQTTFTPPMRICNDALDASLHGTQLWFTVMNSVGCVSLISSSAVQVMPVRQITTWLLGINEADKRHETYLCSHNLLQCFNYSLYLVFVSLKKGTIEFHTPSCMKR